MKSEGKNQQETNKYKEMAKNETQEEEWKSE